MSVRVGVCLEDMFPSPLVLLWFLCSFLHCFEGEEGGSTFFFFRQATIHISFSLLFVHCAPTDVDPSPETQRGAIFSPLSFHALTLTTLTNLTKRNPARMNIL